jgi:membrane associated rhomboid family serine protease
MLRLTPVVRNLIIINVVVYLIQRLMPGNISDYLALWHINTPNFRPYQLFTYMFAHSRDSFFHILFNMLMLAFFGPILEEVWGQKRFLIFYTVCGIGAGIFNIMIDLFIGQPSFGSMIGASGAVYGVMTAFGITFPDMEMRLMFLPISFKAKFMVLVMGTLAIWQGLRPSTDGVAHLAHLGGIVMAILMIQVWRSRGTN